MLGDSKAAKREDAAAVSPLSKGTNAADAAAQQHNNSPFMLQVRRGFSIAKRIQDWNGGSSGDSYL